MMATYTVSVHCPYCQGDSVVKNGTRAGKQIFLCRGCKKQFRDTDATNGHKVPAEQIGAAIEMYYRGMSYKQIAEAMERMFDRGEPSKATIYEWVQEYTGRASEQLEGQKPEVGDEWVADEIAVDIDDWQMWVWNIMDTKTRYVLAANVSRYRGQKDAAKMLEKAKAEAGKDPKTIKTDKLRSYGPAIKKVFPKTLHIKSQGIRSSLNNNLSERLQGTIRSRDKTRRGMESIPTGQTFMDGWTIYYNHMRDHEALDGRTPAQAAKVKHRITEWAEVVKGDTTPQVFAIPQVAKTPKVETAELTLASPKCSPKKQSLREESSPTPRATTSAGVRTVAQPKPVKAAKGKAAPQRKGKGAKQHPMYKLRQRIRKSQRGGRQ